MSLFFIMVGRPRIYETVEELEAAIIGYFYPLYIGNSKPQLFNGQMPQHNCDKPGFDEKIYSESLLGISDKDDVFRYRRVKVSVTGLALHLGFADKSTLYEYRDRPEFSYPIKRALSMIEQYHEERLSENNVTGAIFALKNMGWKDKQEVEQSGGLNINWNEVRTYETK